MKAKVNGVQIAYTDQGKGTPLVFLHGFPLSKEAWEPQVKALSDHYRVIAIDLRGHGESDAPLWHYTMGMYVGDVIGLLDKLSIDKAVFVGLSMGGYILFTLYFHYPDRVKALILADTRATSDTPEVREGRFKMAQVAYRRGLGPIADAMILKLLAPETIDQQVDLVDRLRKIITGNTLAGVAGDLMAMSERADSSRHLSKIKCPTLIMVGDQDVATPPSEVKALADQINGSRFELIPNAGHLSNLENPEAFNRAVKQFLTSL